MDNPIRPEQIAQEALERIEIIFNSNPDAVVISRLSDGYITDINRAFSKISGYTKEESIGNTTIGLNLWVNPDDRQKFIRELEATGFCENLETQFSKKNGGQITGILSAGITHIQGIPYIVSTTRDISKSKQAEQKNAVLQLWLKALMASALEGIHIMDMHGNLVEANATFCNMLGYTPEEIVKLHVSDWDAQWSREELLERFPVLVKLNSALFETRHRRKDGTVFDVEVSSSGAEIDGQYHLFASSRDISNRKKTEQEIHQLAFYDPLTLLPNRRLLLDRLNHALATSMRNGRHGALLFLDLDNFKVINDTQGHEMGDHLLIEVARRLLTCVREGDSVARLGGDEYVVVLEDLSSEAGEAAAQTESVAEKIRNELKRPYVIEKHRCLSSASIGISLFFGHQENAEDLLQHADVAMYQAKTSGRDAIRFFDPRMQMALEARAAMEEDLRNALELDQFRLYYQVQVSSLGRPLGAEVLLRWNHPQRGLVDPVEFISLAEETGLILPIGSWVLQTACVQLKAWQNSPLMRGLTLAVNVSARQFRQADFVAQVHGMLTDSGAQPSLLKLELTENIVLENVEDTISKLLQIKHFGVGFSLDDFGTGYSSLQYLKQLPLDQIKIDQTFVSDIATNANDAAIIQTIIAMSGALELDVIAEGVETEAQRAFLELHGCHAFQGYLFGSPVPLERFEQLIRGSRTPIAAS